MPAKLEITRIRVSNSATGHVYADGLLFNVPAPPAGTMCTWQMWFRNVGDESCYVCIHIRALYPYPGDWVNQCYPIEFKPGQDGFFGAEWGYPSEPFVEWRFSVEREVAGRRVVDDAYFIVATPTALYSSRTEVAPPAEVETRLTLNPIVAVAPGQNYSYTGRLVRADTGAGLPNELIHCERQEAGVWIEVQGSPVTTRSDGSYVLSTPAPSVPGSYLCRARYLGTPGYYAPSSSLQLLNVGVFPVTAPIAVATGIILTSLEALL